VLELRRSKGPVLDLPLKPGRDESNPLPAKDGSQGLVLLGATATLLVAALGAYWFGTSIQRGSEPTAVATATVTAPASATPRAAEGVSQAPAQPAGVNTAVAIRNRSNAVIVELRISAVSDTDWGPDELGNEVLAPGKDFIVAPDSAKGCRYDVLVKFADGSTDQREGVDFCKIETLEFGRR
jgi:hypothetical protein